MDDVTRQNAALDEPDVKSASGSFATSLGSEHSAAAQLSFKEISHSFGSVEAVSNVSLDVASGEVVSLLGASGCGKTTLLRIAAGVERPTAGRVLLGGVEIVGPSVFVPPEKRGIGIVFQDFALFPHLTVLKNVMFGLKGQFRAEAEGIARAALARVDLAGYEANYPHMLSGGQKQRVALARAVAPSPTVIVMDEPFSGLDTRLREQVRSDTFSVLRAAGMTCIFVTHDPQEAMRSSDRIGLMRDGALIQIGTPTDFYRKPADLETARFFSEINEIPANSDGITVTSLFGAHRISTQISGDVTLCIRPTQVRLCSDAHEGVPGRVLAHEFSGDREMLAIKIDGLDTHLRAEVGIGSRPDSKDVRVVIDDRDALIFPSR